MHRGLVICTLAAGLAAVTLYRLVPNYPSGLNISLKAKLRQTLFNGFFKLLLAAESFGFIEESAIPTREAYHKVFRNTQIDLSQHPEVNVENSTIGDVPVLIFRSANNDHRKTPAGALVYFHGGAFFAANTVSHFLWTKQLAIETGAVIISVDYRLAPEHPFPAGVEDCVKVTKTVFDEAEKYEIDPSRIMVGGESAGGNLAAVVAVELASSGNKYRLKGQLLLSPVMQVADITRIPSYKAYGSLLSISRDWIVFKYAGLPFSSESQHAMLSGQHLTANDKSRLARFLNMKSLADDVKSLLPPDHLNEINSDTSSLPTANEVSPSPSNKVLARLRDLVVSERAWPLLTEDDEKLRRMCPAFISIAEFDPLRDEEFLYYERLRSIGAKVAMIFMRGVGHAEPVVSVISNRPLSENARTKYIPEIMAFVKTQLSSN